MDQFVKKPKLSPFLWTLFLDNMVIGQFWGKTLTSWGPDRQILHPELSFPHAQKTALAA